MKHKRNKLQKQIKALRERRGVSVYDLREIFHLNGRLKAHIEDGDMNVSLRSLIAYLDTFGAELHVRYKTIRASEFELEMIKQATGVDILELLSQGEKKT